MEYISGTAPSSQGKFLPGSHIPVVSEEEIMAQLDYIPAWEGKFLIVVTDMHVL